VESLRAQLERQPDNRDLRRQLGEALLESGEREEGTRELELTMDGLERDGDFRGASAVAEELIRMQPNSVRLHQKQVEYAVRSNDKGWLAAAYLSLAECLFRSGQLDKSRAVYARVLELSPEDPRARSALAAFAPDEGVAGEGSKPAAVEATSPAGSAITPDATVEPAPSVSASASAEPPAPAEQARKSFVDLSDWLREDVAVKSTRMVADVQEPVDQEQVDFAEMLALFKQGVAANVDDTDHESHYDLGVAYKEMGLLDEAIAEFQKALRGTEHRVRAYEALGHCFVEKKQYQIAVTILTRALSDRGNSDDVLVGVLYLLGYACEAQELWQEALRYYERVFAVDIHFRDVGQRLAAVEPRAR
jgi:tetratricopeptide (TPR) repeat protein